MDRKLQQQFTSHCVVTLNVCEVSHGFTILIACRGFLCTERFFALLRMTALFRTVPGSKRADRHRKYFRLKSGGTRKRSAALLCVMPGTITFIGDKVAGGRKKHFSTAGLNTTAVFVPLCDKKADGHRKYFR